MKITITCPGCGRVLHTDSAYAGKKSRCPQCNEAIWVPRVGEPAASEPDDQPADRGAEAATDRVPCPICAELIMADAAKCRFCGHVLKPSGETAIEPPPSVNAPALLSLALGLLSYPAAGICFFFIFGQLIQSLLVAAIVSGLGMVCGIWGIVFAARRRRQGMMTAWTGCILGIFGITIFLLYAALAKRAGDAMGDTAPVMKQILGVQKGAKIPMQCANCGYRFDASPAEMLGQHIEAATKLFQGMGGDINKLLDQAGEGPQGMLCPKCKKHRAFAMFVCPKCHHQFLPEFFKHPGANPTTIKCPNCGATFDFVPGQLFKQLAPRDK